LASEPIQAEKARLRAWARALSAPPNAQDRAQQRLLGLVEARSARTVCLYSAIGSEVPTDRVSRALSAGGAILAYPRVRGSQLELFGVGDPSELRPGYRGIREPPAGALPVELAEVDLFVVPGIAFDRRGNRLGRGGGHYDRLLQAAGPRAHRIGLCYAERVLEELPVAPWDRPVQCIVTENEVIRT
jgi:5-formyltetrahydrofolate cyclo-ligase